jgi:hypothetical protein
MKVPLREVLVTFPSVFDDICGCSNCAWSMTLAAFDDKDRQVIDDGVAAVAASAAKAGGGDLQAVMADGAGYPAKVFRTETHRLILVVIQAQQELDRAGRDNMKV